jgi:hypothetical protein
MGRPKSFQRCDTSNRPSELLRQWRAVSAACGRNLGKSRPRDNRFRTILPAFVLKSIVHGKKKNRPIGKLFLIPGAPLRHIDDAPRNDLARSAGVGGPGAFAPRLDEPVPGLIEGRREDGNGFGIEGALRLTRSGMPTMRVLPRKSGSGAAAIAARFHLLAATIQFT